MADRVHPHGSLPESPPSPTEKPPRQPQSPPKPTLPSQDKTVPPPLTYVVHVPKDQVYRIPPPENAKLFERYTRRVQRRGSPCCCVFLTVATFALLVGAAAGLFYLILRPEPPKYAVEGVAIGGVDLNSTSAMSPEIGLAVRAVNPNDKIGIHYVGGSSVDMYYNGVRLADGAVPALHQSPNSYTVFNMTLKGSGVVLSSDSRRDLTAEQSRGSVPLKLTVKAPVKFKVGAVKTWKITVKLSCDVTVDKLTASAKVVHEDCDYRVNIF
ncbi:NDR1/HIN1-like protein 13 [Rhodamnia argentea]|uniref:NDR1/HIN1-like protein 13 n=1 Tax=Rhodamnia argentea TaxID=178133 RepID=A0A8B8NBM9_9MYRT|nr:NDR1/HIN1-like protein 13 [Rhodamnia argentea]